MRESIDTEEVAGGGVWGLRFGVGFMEVKFFVVFSWVFLRIGSREFLKKQNQNQN